MARKPPTPILPVVFELRHGIRLTVLNRATIPGIADFLAKAMNHFKHHRDVLKTDLYKDGPYRGSIINGRHFGGEADLTHPGDEKGGIYHCRTMDGYRHLDLLRDRHFGADY